MKTAIQISRSLHAKTTKRAMAMGFSSVGDYIAELIERDLAEKPVAKKFLRGKLFPIKLAGNRKSISTLRKDLLDGMFSYMKASEDPGYGYACGYQLKHIDRCAAITRDFLERLSAIPKREAATRVMEKVRWVVLRLNKLNKSCGGTLIETDQRELLCQFIFAAARKAGVRFNCDITEEWREW